jgi:hypothetical protein
VGEHVDEIPYDQAAQQAQEQPPEKTNQLQQDKSAPLTDPPGHPFTGIQLKKHPAPPSEQTVNKD